MGESIQKSGRHFCITKDTCPFSKAQIGRNYDTSPFVELCVWICLKVRRCFRDFVASITSQVASFSA